MQGDTGGYRVIQSDTGGYTVDTGGYNAVRYRGTRVIHWEYWGDTMQWDTGIQGGWIIVILEKIDTGKLGLFNQRST